MNRLPTCLSLVAGVMELQDTSMKSEWSVKIFSPSAEVSDSVSNNFRPLSNTSSNTTSFWCRLHLSELLLLYSDSLYFTRLLFHQTRIFQWIVSGKREIGRRDYEHYRFKSIKLGKASGNDKITPEMVKCLGETGKRKLQEVLTLAFNTKTIPKDWGKGTIISTFKKEYKRACDNYREITVLFVRGKEYKSMLKEKPRAKLYRELEEIRSRFRGEKSTQDHIFPLRQISEWVPQFNKEACIWFIDLEKAFDRANRNMI